MLSDVRQGTDLLGGSQGSATDERSFKVKMNTARWWNDTDRVNRSTGRKTCPGALYPS
jgi:hypothetical protein